MKKHTLKKSLQNRLLFLISTTDFLKRKSVALSSFHILRTITSLRPLLFGLSPKGFSGTFISHLLVMDKTAYPYETDDTNLYGFPTVPLPYSKSCPGFSETTGRAP